MSHPIRTSVESRRGCGFRKPGGLYLVADGLLVACPKLPITLDVCPTCSGGIKPARGWTWVDGDVLLQPGPHGERYHEGCMLSRPLGRCGLLWIGGSFYPTPADWTREANKMGVSRRLTGIPRGLELGKTVVLVAHREGSNRPCPVECEEGMAGSPGPCGTCGGGGRIKAPAIFHAFVPRAIEYVVKGDESEEEMDRLAARGIEFVDVVQEQPA